MFVRGTWTSAQGYATMDWNWASVKLIDLSSTRQLLDRCHIQQGHQAVLSRLDELARGWFSSVEDPTVAQKPSPISFISLPSAPYALPHCFGSLP